MKTASAERPEWENTTLLGFPDPPPPLRAVRAFPKIELPKLITLGRIPGTKQLLAADHERGYAGPSRVHQFSEDAESLDETLFLERPEIIYGFAFHPNFEQNRFVYVGCNGKSEELGAIATRVLRFTVSNESPFVCDPASAQVIIEWKSNGHNGGDLVFGENGLLYISTGDGTSDSDGNRAGQDLGTLNAAMLRIDVDRSEEDSEYSVPKDNPFVEMVGARPEIWSYGLRNPWRIAYDVTSGQLWAGNNGQDLWESVYLVQKGANYGWSIKESNHPFHPEQDSGPVSISTATFEHHHSEARSLTGGPVYRGSQFPELGGAYIYGDFATGNIWAIRHDGEKLLWQKKIARSSIQITDFEVDSAGEILIADHVGGLYRLERNESSQVRLPFPRMLSETGLFSDLKNETAADGLIAYRVNSPLWSDGAIKRRWMALPSNKTIGYKSRGSYDFPDQSVLVKSFAFPENATEKLNDSASLRRVETRLMVKLDGEWFGYSYRWNEDQTDAELVEASGKDETLEWATGIGQQQNIRWRYPSRSECMVCHSRAANFALGLSNEQLHVPGLLENNQSQVARLGEFGLFGADWNPEQLTKVRTLVPPHDERYEIADRARSYLHSNCSVCHVKEGGGNSKLILSFFAQGDKMRLWGEDALHRVPQLQGSKLAVAGKPDLSLLLSRVSHRGPGQMPPLATNHLDEKGIRLLRQWIVSKELPLRE
ncbi:MAG: PQQ-dependent sugar dehydrogenase [Planctomycetota bacterium]|nr:PQQ-dependent sugar dehydrogenase [Planctomycetota bacterium]